jgi:hypothetical protein
MKKLNLFASVMTVLFLSFNAVQAQTADEIVKKYLDAVGGVDAWKKLESIKQVGTLTLVTQGGMSISFSTFAARPNLTRQEGEFQGMKFIEAYDGKIAWTVNPFAGAKDPTKKGKDETDEAAKESFEDEFIDYATKGNKIELMGNEEIEGTKTFKVKLTRKSGEDRFYFFDAQTFLPIMVRTVGQTGQSKGVTMETYMSDYKKVEGIMVPYSVEQKSNGESQVIIKAEKVELNAKLNKKEIFDFPETAAPAVDAAPAEKH